MYIWRVKITGSILVVACAAATMGVSVAASAQTPGYHYPGDSPPTPWSGVTALSADGRVSTGVYGNGANYDPFLWSESSGRYNLWPVDPASRFSYPNALSSDGAVLAGTSGDQRAFRWNGPGTYQRLGTLPTHDFTAGNGISGDGSIVVGRAWSNLSSRGEAWRWTQDGGMQRLGFAFPGQNYSEANAISRDGNVIVGMSQGANSTPFAWTAATGMRVLPLLPGATSGNAFGTNHDGSIIAGLSGGIGVLWTGSTVQALTNPVGWTGNGATDVSDDGSVVIGTLNNAGQISLPHIWTPSTGWRSPANYFAAQGFPIPAGWTVTSVSSLSADGRTFGGSMRFAGDLLGRAFVLTVPAPGAVAWVGGALVLLTRRVRAGGIEVHL